MIPKNHKNQSGDAFKEEPINSERQQLIILCGENSEPPNKNFVNKMIQALQLSPTSEIKKAFSILQDEITPWLKQDAISVSMDLLSLGIEINQLTLPTSRLIKRAAKDIDAHNSLRSQLDRYDELGLELQSLQNSVLHLPDQEVRLLAGLLSNYLCHSRKQTHDFMMNNTNNKWGEKLNFFVQGNKNYEIDRKLALSVRIMDQLASGWQLNFEGLVQTLVDLDNIPTLYHEATKLISETNNPNGLPSNHRNIFDGVRAISIVAITHARAYMVPSVQKLLQRLGEKTELDTLTLPPEAQQVIDSLPKEPGALGKSLKKWIDKTPVFMGSHAVIRICDHLINLGESECQVEHGNAIILINTSPPTSADNTQFARFYDKLGRPMPLQVLPDSLNIIMNQLNNESPWMQTITNRLFMTIRTYMAQDNPASGAILPPLLLLGSPGSGKTHYLHRLAELLGFKHRLVPMGGMSDSMTLRGAPRGYNSARPGLFVQTIEQYAIANPLFILDELEKVADSRHNGNPHDVLLQLLEPLNARCFYDECLQVNVNLSHVLILATANSLDTIPEPVRDRFIVLRVPDPSDDDLQKLARRLWVTEMSNFGFTSMSMPAYPEELINQALGASYSLRKLSAGVKKVAGLIIDSKMKKRFFH